MTLRHFQIFKTVCNEESITLAAEKLSMTQPAVSIAIKELETFYKVKLFERMNRRIFITQAGHCLLQYATTVLSQFDESINVIRDAGQFKNCCLGVNITIGETTLPVLLKRIYHEHPEYNVTAKIRNSHEIEKMLLRNDIDFAIVDNISAISNFTVIPLFTDKMVVVCSENYRKENALTLQELSKQKLLLREVGSCTRTCIDSAFQTQSLSPLPYVESTSTLTLINCAKASLGITILPYSIIKKDVTEGLLKILNINDSTFTREYYIIYHKNKFITTCMQSIIETVKNQYNL